MSILWDQHLAQRARKMTSSAIRELLKVTEQPEFISFAGGLPAPEVFPVAEVAEVAQRILHTQGAQALQYGATEGYGPLRQVLAQQISANGFQVSVDNILITTGSQQALDLLGKIFLDPGDPVIVESPTYLAALQAWNSYGARYIEAPSDADGIIVSELGAALQARPKFLYTIPNFQNPTGVTLPLERRERLVEMAARADLPIVEDDPYRALRFEGDHLPRLLDLDAQQQGSATCYQGNVIYLSTFSKVLSPGLRVGWVVAAPEVITRLVQAKQGVDLHTATFNQMIAYDLLGSGFIEQHTQFIVQTYRERRDVMLAALHECLPPEVQWTHPQGGMFLWVTLPDRCDAQELLGEMIPHKVAFVPGQPFFTSGKGSNTFRLNFSNSTPDKITEGIARLGRTLDTHINRAVLI